MSDMSVTITFPTVGHLEEFLGWMSDGGGEQEFMDMLELRGEVSHHLSLRYADDNHIHVVEVHKE